MKRVTPTDVARTVSRGYPSHSGYRGAVGEEPQFRTDDRKDSVEKPSDLRAICQAGKGSAPAWYSIHRRVSIYLTWALLHTPIRLNQVTLLMMACGLGGAGLAASSRLDLNLTGFGLLYLGFLLDKVDGEIARYRNAESVRGILLDRFNHRLVEPCLLLASAVREYRITTSSWVLLAALGSIVLANIIEENQQLSPYILLKHLRETRRWPQRSRPGTLARILDVLHRLARPLKSFRTFIVVLPMLALAYALEATTRWPWITWYFTFSVLALGAFVVIQSAWYYAVGLDREIDGMQSVLASSSLPDVSDPAATGTTSTIDPRSSRRS